MRNIFYFCRPMKCNIKMRVLIVTEHDDALGPMAAAFLRDYSTHLDVVSVGRNPVQNLHPSVVVAMKECLVNLEGYVPKGISEIDVKQFEMVKEWPEMTLPSDLETFRKVRDRIKNESFLFYRDVIRKQYKI